MPTKGEMICMKKAFRIIAASALVLVLFAGCGKTEKKSESGKVVKIGVLEPLSGKTSYYGDVQSAGIQLYVDYINKNGGIKSLGGAKIELVPQDSAGDPETGVSAFELLVEQGVSAIIGPYNSTVAAATAPLAIQHKIPYLIVNATSENFMGTANKYVYRTNTGSSDGDQLQTMFIKYLSDKIGGKFDSVGIVYDSGDWGTAAVKSWRGLSQTLGFKVTVDEAVNESTTDMSTLVNKIKNAKCDLVIVAAFSNASNLLARQMSEYKCPSKMLGLGGGFGDAKFIENLGPMAENILYTSTWLPIFGGASQEAIAWNDEFKTRKGFNMTLESSWGWLGAGTLATAIEAAGSTDREKIADALYKIDIGRDNPALWFSIYEGVKFATDGQKREQFKDGVRYNNNAKLGLTAGLVIVQVQSGKWTVVFPTSETGGKDLIVYP
jgi:branched-chain amino acid transport system substrate-binding protein